MSRSELFNIESRNDWIGRTSQLEDKALFHFLLVFFFLCFNLGAKVERALFVLSDEDNKYNEEKEAAKAGYRADDDGLDDIVLLLLRRQVLDHFGDWLEHALKGTLWPIVEERLVIFWVDWAD